MYCLYYLDSQLAICCNIRPLLTALEVKYELPCRDDIWSAASANAWGILMQAQDLSFNEEDDDEANGEPRPAQGDLYESIAHLMNPDPPGRPLGLLWYSSFASLMLIIQIQMMARDLTMASTFLYNNIRSGDNRHNLAIITEGSRAPVMQALNALADLMPRPSPTGYPLIINRDQTSTTTDPALWHPVWIAWHYTVICLTHQDALLTSGIVEYSLPTAISTAWELGKPRSKQHRDVYEDRDVIRVVDNVEHNITLLTGAPMASALQGTSGVNGTTPCIEDPFTTMIGFKACVMGWRVVRLMALGLEQNTTSNSMHPPRPSMYSLSAQIVLGRIMEAIDPEGGNQPQSSDEDFSNRNSGHHSGVGGHDPETRYLEWTERTFAMRDLWPPGEWVVAVFNETRQEAR
jgi:hypothetical protein